MFYTLRHESEHVGDHIYIIKFDKEVCPYLRSE